MIEEVPTIRTSEERDFKLCHQKWQWSWVEGLETRGSRHQALTFGTGIHLALQHWFVGPGLKRGPHPSETWEKFADEWLDFQKIENPNPISDTDIDAQWEPVKKLGSVMLEEYVKLYGIDQSKLVISRELAWQAEIPWPEYSATMAMRKTGLMPTNGKWAAVMARWVGTFDGVYRHADTGQLWVDETKTCAAIPNQEFLKLDPQASKYYAMAAGTLYSNGLITEQEMKRGLAGISYDYLKKALPDERPKDREGYATNQPVKADYITALDSWYSTTGKDTIMPDLKKYSMMDLQELASACRIRVLGARSKQQPASNFARYHIERTQGARARIMRGMQDTAYEMQAYRAGLLPITISPGRDCPRCDFFQLCEMKQELGEKSLSFQDYKNSAYKVVDRYDQHKVDSTEELNE